jgi:hypothetical protein
VIYYRDSRAIISKAFGFCSKKEEKSHKTWQVLSLVIMRILNNGSYLALASSMVGNTEKVLNKYFSIIWDSQNEGAATPVAKIFQTIHVVDFGIWEQ